MHIRLSTASDYNAIATVTVKAHVSDVRIAHLYPGRDAHPEAYHRYHVKDIDNYALEPQNFVVVAETEPSDPGWTGETQIAGYSCWSRACKSAATRQRWRAKESLGQSTCTDASLACDECADEAGCRIPPSRADIHTRLLRHNAEQPCGLRRQRLEIRAQRGRQTR